MKKILITALLAVSAALTPSLPGCLLNALDVPGRASQLAGAAASPIFWHLWDEVLTRSLAHLTETRSSAQPAQPATQSISTQSVTVAEWQPESEADAVACFVFHMVVAQAVKNGLSAAQKTGVSLMSISWPLVRRTIERGFPLAHQRSATMHLTQSHSRHRAPAQSHAT